MYANANLLSDSRTRKAQYRSAAAVDLGVPMADEIVGEFQRITVSKDATDWAYVFIEGGADAVGDVAEGKTLCMSCFARINGEAARVQPIVIQGNGLGIMHGDYETKYTDVGGGWTFCATKAVRNAEPYTSQGFYFLSALVKHGTTVDIAQPMVCVSDGPHAWAPAAGEVWPK